MTPAQRRTALDALGAVGSALARLDPSLDAATAAMRLVEAWECVERSLQTLGGDSTLTGQALIRDLRHRNLLTLGQAHALVELHSAHDRVGQAGYGVTAGDIEAARHALAEVERVVSLAPDTHAATHSHAATPVAVTPRSSTPAPAVRSPRRGPSALLALVILLVLAGGGAFWAYGTARGGEPADVRAGAALMARGSPVAAAEAFNRAAIDHPSLASPHIYLARIARDRGDLPTARAELVRAIKLEPNNALAQREMGSLLLASGDTELATSFYARAIARDTTDRVAKGFLGCALARLGRADEASRWLTRAGEGEWSACARALAP